MLLRCGLACALCLVPESALALDGSVDQTPQQQALTGSLVDAAPRICAADGSSGGSSKLAAVRGPQLHKQATVACDPWVSSDRLPVVAGARPAANGPGSQV